MRLNIEGGRAMHRREFLRNAFGLAAIATAVAAIASPAEAARALADPLQPGKDERPENEHSADRAEADRDETLEIGARRGGRGRHRGWGRGRRRGWAWGRRRRWGWRRRRWWGWRRRRRVWYRRRRWWGWRRRRYFRRRLRRRFYYY